MQGYESPPLGTVPVNRGDVLGGKYVVERILGVGGMGVVVAATHLQLHNKVALKFMLPEALQLPALVERFAREARAAARLKSDHVARVLDVGELASGSPYMVMEYLEGNDLGSVVESQGALPIEGAVDCVLQACDAVAEAHRIGIVHRDLKPRNLFLTTRNDGRALIKVLDFGIAKQKTTASDLSLTRTTEVIGSPNYMSPEQLRSARAVDERSDIWALGVILYELLSGTLPFAAESVTQLIAMVLTDPPRPIRRLREEVPEDLWRAIEKCLQKEPAARFASIAELALALERFAPADTREIAVRIARMASGSQAGARSIGGFAARGPTGTTGNSWANTELARAPRSRILVVSAVLGGAAIVGAIAVLGVTRLRHDGRATSSTATSAAPTADLGPPPVASATATNPPKADPPPAAVRIPDLPLPASARPVQAPTSPAPVPTAAPAAAGGTPQGHPVRPPHHDVPVAPSAPPSASAPPTNEPPRYRPTW